jgi:hypothetical protein
MPPRYFTNYPDAGSRPIEKNSSAKYCFVLSGDGWSISPVDNHAPVADEARMPTKRAKAAGKAWPRARAGPSQRYGRKSDGTNGEIGGVDGRPAWRRRPKACRVAALSIDGHKFIMSPD